MSLSPFRTLADRVRRAWNTPSKSQEPDERIFTLRASDQRIVAALVAIGAASLLGAWLWLGGASGGLVEFDRQPHREPTFQVDVNLAGWPELALLPGIGETLARRIVERREKIGPFRSVDELLSITGVGRKKLELMRPFVMVGEMKAPNGQ